jgi:septum formation protein
MAKHLPKLILASRSPRRRELLAAAGYEFEVVAPSEAAEEGEKGTGSVCAHNSRELTAPGTAPGTASGSDKPCLSPFLRRETPHDLVSRLARQKADDVSRRIDRGLVIGCDTVVECNGQILGKPADEADARAMLTTLSGQTHRVLSGLCLMEASGDCGGCGAGVPPASESCRRDTCTTTAAEPLVAVAVTTLRMDDLTPQQLNAYLATGQWQGKAGAFGYQDGLDWVHVVKGSESNVVGLPMELLIEMLESLDFGAVT